MDDGEYYPIAADAEAPLQPVPPTQRYIVGPNNERIPAVPETEPREADQLRKIEDEIDRLREAA
jgi:hypothetical protein